MVHEVVGVSGSHWVVTQPGINPCGARHCAVIPSILDVVICNVPVDRDAICRAVEPPSLVKPFIGTAKYLYRLLEVDITVDVLAQVAA